MLAAISQYLYTNTECNLNITVLITNVGKSDNAVAGLLVCAAFCGCVKTMRLVEKKLVSFCMILTCNS